MAFLTLSQRDVNVLDKIKDPETDPATAQLIDSSMPKDPQVVDQAEYNSLSRREQEIVRRIQQLEMQLAGLQPKTADNLREQYQQCAKDLGDLVAEHPRYASARNNRAQALRRLYSDSMLVRSSSGQNLAQSQEALLPETSPEASAEAAATVLQDLDKAISLLTPMPYTPMSPQAARTLSMAHTQRAALYHRTTKLMSQESDHRVMLDAERPELRWSKLEFEEAASRDFALGGRYGNDIAKGLAVSTNPTAKLCGQMVREALRKEYGNGYGS
jgi:hypothetical protein